MNDIYLNIGRLMYVSRDSIGSLAIDQCKRGAQSLGVEWHEIQSTCRKRRIIDARRLCCSHLRTKGWTFDRIAEALGYTNHSTVLHHVTKAEEMKVFDKDFLNKHLTFIQA